ncbi:amidase-like protein [Trichoderma citrinoviride]|uniref:Amidase-like protein n=1 Tax=Trichoderma citrinoviride TaxID=58853 RepID=A0A2T4BB25_9HYPO|nr:amidase-like protein [Trichoderma citrinoviride]PTB66530.1 amidase-like protein [Trichoderma citrinoviride]
MRPVLALATALRVLSFPCLSHARPTADGDFPPLLDATLADLRLGLDSDMFTSVDLVTAYIDRILEVNSVLKAVTEINPDALLIASERDAERRAGIDPAKQPLHGIPILLKNNIATDDEMNNTAGSYALLGAKVPEDSTIAAKLRKAGAIILGKANMSQWAASRELVSHEGWSAHGGQAVGAYFPKQNPRGSSSGSAVSASLGLAWAAVGTDTGGSILLPGHANNVVGFRPTVGLTSRYLVIPYSERQDTVGTLTRTVKDAAYLMQAMAGPDTRDNYTDAIPFDELPDYVAACTDSGLKGKRLGVSRNTMAADIDPTAKTDPEAFERALDVLRAAGAEIIDDIELPCTQAFANDLQGQDPPFSIVAAVFSIVGADFLSDLPTKYLDLLKENPNNISSVRELREFTRENPHEGFPRFDTGSWDNFLSFGINNTAPSYWSNVTAITEYLGPLCFTGALDKYKLDAMVLPTPHSVVMASGLGLPVVSVPLGRSPDDTPIIESEQGNLILSAPNGPFGIAFSGAAFSEEKLFAMAYDFEQRMNVRPTIKPFISPKTELAQVVRKRCVGDRGGACGKAFT